MIVCGAEESFHNFIEQLRRCDPMRPPVVILHPKPPRSWSLLQSMFHPLHFVQVKPLARPPSPPLAPNPHASISTFSPIPPPPLLLTLTHPSPQPPPPPALSCPYFTLSFLVPAPLSACASPYPSHTCYPCAFIEKLILCPLKEAAQVLVSCLCNRLQCAECLWSSTEPILYLAHVAFM